MYYKYLLGIIGQTYWSYYYSKSFINFDLTFLQRHQLPKNNVGFTGTKPAQKQIMLTYIEIHHASSVLKFLSLKYIDKTSIKLVNLT